MTHSINNIFTDAIKDVIGNDPVLDQFDISYDASFYGTMQDDYVTGSILSEITPINLKKFGISESRKNLRNFITGTRGRHFSKYYARNASSYDSVPFSPDASLNPYLSFRLVPPYETTARTYRITQHFDSDERYYDSCLPQLDKCFRANGASLWSMSQENPYMLSPYRNVQTDKLGFITFNTPYTTDRTSQGYSTDPLVDNSWTWSFPYESRYSPLERNVKTNDAFGINSVKLEAGGAGFSNLTSLKKPRAIQGIVPLLPGKLPIDSRFPEGRPAFRIPAVLTSSTTGVIPATFSDSRLDPYFGYEWMIPSDVYLNTRVDHNYLLSYPRITPIADAPLTGSMNYVDTVKFLFGFGDLNNMQYGYASLDMQAYSTASYGFESGFPTVHTGAHDVTTVPNPLVSNVGGITGDIIKMDWRVSPPTGSALTPDGRGWCVSGSTGTVFYGINYNYIGSLSPVAGVFWASSSSPSNQYVLRSDKDVNNGGNLIDDLYPYVVPWDTSIAAVDITSSVPWSLKYRRAVVSHVSDGLLTYFSAFPGAPAISGALGYFPFVPIEFVRGRVPTFGGAGYSFMEQFDMQTTGSSDKFPEQLTSINPSGPTSFTPYELPLQPGEYRLCFAYIKSGSAATPGSYSTPDFAAIDDIELKYWLPDSIQPDPAKPKMGGNNYPTFKRSVGDARYEPVPFPDVYPFNTPVFVSGSADAYKSYSFGISPVIRGWKYGLYSGLPRNSKAVFRRDRFGQIRDMLEQRQYTKFISVGRSPTDDVAITVNNRSSVDKEMTSTKRVGQLSPGVVSVNFVKQTYKKDDRGIGNIYSEMVDPASTTSQNLSNEVTSSLPYFDGVSRSRL